MPRLHLNICLSDIPKDLIRRAGNGKCYINLNVSELREMDERGNDHTISVFVPQDRRADYPDKVYIGRGKLHTDQPAPRPAPTPRPQVEDLPEGDTGLPF